MNSKNWNKKSQQVGLPRITGCDPGFISFQRKPPPQEKMKAGEIGGGEGRRVTVVIFDRGALPGVFVKFA